MTKPPTPSLAIKAIIHRAVLFGAAWITLVQGHPEGLLLGVPMVALAVHLSLRLLPPRNPLDLWRLLLHLPRFIKASFIGGVDVARRAFSPSMPLKPGWVTPSVKLPDAARVALGAELSLMPGTLAAGTHEGRLIVHVLDTEAGLDLAIAGEEAELAAIIGLEHTLPSKDDHS